VTETVLHAPDCPDAGKRGSGNCIVPARYAQPEAVPHSCLDDGLTEYVVEITQP
jgi:hypothetical protein